MDTRTAPATQPATQPTTQPTRDAALTMVTDGPVLVLAGHLDARSTFRVRNALYDLLDAHDGVAVDLRGVTVIDMVALKMLAAATRRTAAQGRRLTVRACNPAVRRMMHLSRIARLVEVERASA